MPTTKGFVRKLSNVARVPCPCGQAARIITGEENERVSIHRVKIEGKAKKHYHKVAAEHYIVLSGSGEVELDDERFVVTPGDVIYIPPFTQHALRGHFEIINVVAPPFHASDEYLAED